MKKTVLFALMLSMVITTSAQKDDLTFFMKNGAKGIKETKCSDLGELWVTVPIPANIADYDNFTVFVYLSTIQSELSSQFNKDKIKNELVGKKTVDLFVLGPEGTKKTNFGDFTVFNDLCNTPRNKGLTNFDVDVYSKAFKIVRWEKVTKWDESQSAYITTDNAIWDEGIEVSKSKFTIIQTPLADGVKDTKSTFSFKIPNLAATTFNNYTPQYGDQFYSQATIIDKSVGQDIMLRVLAIKSDVFSLEQLTGDFTKWLESAATTFSKLKGGTAVYNPNFKFTSAINEDMNTDWRAKFGGIKEKALSDFTIGAITGKQFTWYQDAHFDEYGSSIKMHGGVYCKLYFFQHGQFTYIAFAALEDKKKDEYKSVSFQQPIPIMKKDYFSYKITPENAAEANKLIIKVMETISFLQ
jgi:hypothetical protein